LTDQIKNRVVGTVVLFTLAIIFLPDIFDGEKNELKEEFAVIPAKPVADNAPLTVVDVDAVEQPEEQQQQVVPSPSVHVDKKQVQSKKVDVPTSKPVTKTFKRTGWVIQMGIFKQVSSVKPYLAKLRGKGFNAFSVPNIPKAGQSTTVYVGPDLDKKRLAKLQPKLKAAFNESGYLKKFDPTPDRDD